MVASNDNLEKLSTQSLLKRLKERETVLEKLKNRETVFDKLRERETVFDKLRERDSLIKRLRKKRWALIKKIRNRDSLIKRLRKRRRTLLNNTKDRIVGKVTDRIPLFDEIINIIDLIKDVRSLFDFDKKPVKQSHSDIIKDDVEKLKTSVSRLFEKLTTGTTEDETEDEELDLLEEINLIEEEELPEEELAFEEKFKRQREKEKEYLKG